MQCSLVAAGRSPGTPAGGFLGLARPAVLFLPQVPGMNANPFYRKLKDDFPELFSQIATQKWLLCVPQSSSLRGVTLDMEFIQMHVLQGAFSDRNSNVPCSRLHYINCRVVFYFFL